MARKPFDDFVKQQQVSDGPEQLDWNKQLQEWLGCLEKLYKTIESFLAPYTSSQQITIIYDDITLNEENIGTYKVRRMRMKIGRQEVIFIPKGTNLIGAKGRVDVSGPNGNATILLVDKNASSARSLIRVSITVTGELAPPSPPSKKPEDIIWTWKIGTPPPEVKFIELNQDAFFNLIMSLANG